ncbi:MAG: topoisomerase DNA-binding C4 zinc finger domain-containing protein [Lachnospiraceae bacterium]|nr:topoisomerase DNA-binding C4 zinc finger domain-containing protein [Lachnospiraceae bacterium]
MLSDRTGKRISSPVQDYVLFDLETTGTSCRTDEVVEISAVKVAGGIVTEEFTTLVNPGMPIPFYASAVNGITDDMVAGSPCFEKAFADFLRFAGDAILVGHNIIRFDLQFLYRDAEKYWGKTVGNDFVDTLEIARAYLPQLHHYTLGDLATHYGISTAGAHRALNDCRMNQQVYEHLKQEMEHPSDAAKAVRRCPRCGNVLKRRSGKFGEFWGCASYPDCKYTANM